LREDFGRPSFIKWMDATATCLTLGERPWHGRRRVTAGDSAIAHAVRAHESILFATARRLCGNEADADDLVHDAYERALRGWDRYADRGNLKGWLLAIVHNLFIDRCRKARREAHEPIDLHEIAVPEPVAPPAWTDVTPEQVARAIAALADEFRQVYELHAKGHSYDEIAAALAIPKATVGTRLLRARKKLKEAFVRELGGAR
jgi:RNA polymerase sigma-70 factor, ECF subfamily